MNGSITTRPASRAAAISLADQSAHLSFPVMTSRSTHESTRVAERIAATSFATEQRHDLVGTHARYFLAGGRAVQPANQSLPSALGPLSADDLQRVADLDASTSSPACSPCLARRYAGMVTWPLLFSTITVARSVRPYYIYYVIMHE